MKYDANKRRRIRVMKDPEEKNCAINGCFFDGPPGISELVSGVYWSMFTLQGFAGGKQGM